LKAVVVAGQYSLKSFLRAAPNALLDQYFKATGIDLDVSGLKETQIEPIAATLDELPKEQLDRVETDFKNVHLLANEAGGKALHQELANLGRPDAMIATDKKTSLITLALETLLCFPKAFADALIFRPYFDQDRYWRKVTGLTFRMPDDSLVRCDYLAACLKTFFRHNDGRGRNCKVDYYRREERHFFFAFPEDYPQTMAVWEKGNLQPSFFNPAFEVVFVVTEGSTYSLDTCYRGSKPDSQALSDVFAEAMFDAPIARELYDRPSYDLFQLKRRSFRFAYSAESGIERMAIRKLRFSVGGGDPLKVTLDANAHGDRGSNAIHEAIERVFRTADEKEDGRVPIAVARPTWTEIVAEFRAANRKRCRRRSFTISTPDSCSLKHDGEDLILREVLQASSIEIPPDRAA
jgi:hypothetical protein